MNIIEEALFQAIMFPTNHPLMTIVIFVSLFAGLVIAAKTK